jgi:hypothetical protein
MPWHRFIFTRAFWFDGDNLSRESVVYSAMGLFAVTSLIAIPALVLGAPGWVLVPWWVACVIAMLSWVVV